MYSIVPPEASSSEKAMLIIEIGKRNNVQVETVVVSVLVKIEGPRGGHHGYTNRTVVKPNQYTFDWREDEALAKVAKSARKALRRLFTPWSSFQRQNKVDLVRP